MDAASPNEPQPRSLQSRLVTINAALCGIGALIYVIEGVMVIILNLRATYVWLPLTFALFLVIAGSVVFSFLGIIEAFRSSFLENQPQRVFTKLQRFSTRSCVSLVPFFALIAFCSIVGEFFKSF